VKRSIDSAAFKDVSGVIGPLKGCYHYAYAVPLDPGSWLGRKFKWLKLREQRFDVDRFDARCFSSEDALLIVLADHIPRVPTVLTIADGVSVHNFIEGETLAQAVPTGAPLPERHLVQIEALFRSLAAFDVARLDGLKRVCVSGSRDRDSDDSGAFLQSLVDFTHTEVCQAHLPQFGELFEDLGISDDALPAFGKEAPPLTTRPYALLHGDLHRENFIVDPRGRLWTIDWELARIGDPVYELATHLHLMRYSDRQMWEVLHRWRRAVEEVRPGATRGVEQDLPVYLGYKRLQSVYTDVIRSATTLRDDADRSRAKTEHVATTVARSLARAHGVLGMRRNAVPSVKTVASMLNAWVSRNR
jgi:hypothetical protein